MNRRRLPVLAGLVAALAACIAAGPTTVSASFHGSNGRLAFASNRDGNDEIYSMNADGSNRVDLTRNPASDVDPHSSADGSQIVFASNRGGDYAVYTMNADGSGVSLVTSAVPNERRPSFTSDGRIVFQSGFFPGRAIFLVNTDGSGLTRLTPDTSDNAGAAPASHGNRIAFSRYDGTTQAVMTMTETGSDVHAVTSPGPGVSDYQPNWSPIGNTLAFIRSATDDTAFVFAVHTDGTGLHRLTSVPDRVESQPAWSPDGRRLVFHACTGFNTPAQRCVLLVANADGTGETDISTPHAPFLETFSSATKDPIWHTIQRGTDTSFVQQNGRLEITIGANSQPSGVFNDIDAHYGLNCSLPGDFDMQVDFSLPEWPAANGSFAQLQAIFANASILRQSAPWGAETYNANSGAAFQNVPTTDLSGTFRLVRSGGQLKALYRDPILGWTTLLSAPAQPDAVTPGLALSANQDFGHQEVKVAFDNFLISSGALSCPNWWDDSAPDWQAT